MRDASVTVARSGLKRPIDYIQLAGQFNSFRVEDDTLGFVHINTGEVNDPFVGISIEVDKFEKFCKAGLKFVKQQREAA